MGLCDESGFFDFRNVCVRASWSAIFPAAFVFALCLSAIPTPKPLRKITSIIKTPFHSFLTLAEAEALDQQNVPGPGEEAEATGTGDATTPPFWRTLVLSWIGLLQTLVWLAVGCFSFVGQPDNLWGGLRPILVAFAWLYPTVRPIARPAVTAPYDLFYLYLLNFIGAILLVGGVIFDHHVIGIPFPPTLVMAALIANLVAITVLLAVVLAMPLAIPSRRVKKEDIGLSVSPEDYTTLLGWISFSWVYPLIKRGRYTTLNEPDVWNLSPTMQARPSFIKFLNTPGATLLRRLMRAHSLDFVADVTGTYISVVFNYGGPFFLKRILDIVALPHPTPSDRARAYIYAFLAFLSAVLKSQADVQHLWYGRRAATRIRLSLMASIYDKALKRKDFSGIVDKDKVKEDADKKAAETAGPLSAADKTKAKEKAAKADDPKAGADVGKIVNLMAGDSMKVSMIMTSLYFLYGAPLEIIIASIFLYQLLGWSAFAGFLVLVAGWPLNSIIARRSIRIQKGVLAARDKRMKTLTELIGAVKFIKFFSWEEQWIKRTMDARDVEMKWIVKSRTNSVMFSTLWNTAPILVSIISFFVYVVRGNELTISVAFTSIALFSMIRQPLNVIPTFIVQLLQTRVSLDRIATYLAEDEVTDQVSSLKKTITGPRTAGDDDEGLGLERASFKWNEVEEVKEQETVKSVSPTSSSSSSDETETAVETEELPDHHFELRDLTVLFPEGELSVVTGPTASGKTALLMALLGEMTLLPGGRIIMSKDPSRVDENGMAHAISYAAQSPWLRHQSIKDNILFGYPLDEQRYNDVVECCALRPDLEQFEDGDATEIGARGVSLSGGQKARVALARAVYARTKYVLLDDPLSAVDSHTSRFLFERLLCGPLLKDRTVILVTHHVELVIPGAFYLIRMLDGRIDTQGTIKDLRAQGVLDDIEHESAIAVKEEEVVTSEDSADTAEEEASPDGVSKSAGDKKKARQLVKDEHRETGEVKFAIYKTYLKASSYWIWAFLLFLIVLNQLLGITEKLWIKTWGDAYGDGAEPSASYDFKSFASSDNEVVMDGVLTSHGPAPSFHSLVSKIGLPQMNWPSAYEHPLFYVGVYAAIGLANVIVGISSAIAQYTGALRASRRLFRQLLVTVVRATTRWHDTTPQGRMLNRFGKDIETIDSSLASSLQAVNSSLATFFASILTVSVVFPWFLLPASLLGFVYRELALGYLNTGRDLRRMESNTRSPIFSDFGELLEGIVTVRAFSAERRFLDNLHKKLDATTKMWYSFWMTNRWLLLNFDVLGATAVLVTTLFSLSGLVDAGLAGLCITSSMAFTTSVYWACRFWTALQLDLNSVERVVEYLDLPQEPPAIIESNRPPAYWPSSSGSDDLLRVEDLVIKYAPELPPVLHGVSFALKAKERVGLLGRTGSGKSTLAMSILRFTDPASGRIIIDGIDISTIGLHDLRSRLTFIPQDATLFSGTLRDNLDPFGEHDDSECLDVLYRVQMISESATPSQGTSRDQSRASSIHGAEREDTADSISTAVTETDTKTSISLTTQVSAGGANFSQGQRQLIAMARALLRRSSIIVLDEATSSIDFATDAKIQATIREEFTDSLLLTVAHRIRTVIDYDRLIVLDKGQIVEFDTPWNLIQKQDGYFRGMCLKSGTFGELEAVAKAKAESSSK